MTAVSGALNPCHHHLFRHTLALTRQTQKKHEVNEAGGQVDLAAVLAGGVVVWKRVVVIMEALTLKKKQHKNTNFICIVKILFL